MISLLQDCWKATEQSIVEHPQTDRVETDRPSESSGLDISSPALLLRVHDRITHTIKSDNDQSMYSSILRYEPMIIEDLVDWLAERHVSLPELVVRAWCDREGVCCVGRESLSGGRRPRY